MLFNYLNIFYITYLNNIIIYSKNKLNYKKYIKKVLQQFYNTSLYTNIKKLKFDIKYIKYLGFIISTNSIKANLEKTLVI